MMKLAHICIQVTSLRTGKKFESISKLLKIENRFQVILRIVFPTTLFK